MLKKCVDNSQPSQQSKYRLSLAALVKVSVMSAIMAALSLVAIPLPFSPLPITLQSLGAMLAGLVLGPVGGTWAVLLYLTLGSIGLPVFAGGRSGTEAILGPSGGYLIGFLPGAWITGMLSTKSKNLFRTFSKAKRFCVYMVSCLLGGIVIVHLFGIIHLARVTYIPLLDAMLIGTVPFLPGDTFKAIAASILASRINSILRHPYR